jgi:hypothetical protein
MHLIQLDAEGRVMSVEALGPRAVVVETAPPPRAFDPAIGAWRVPLWRDGAFVIVPDLTGQVWYDRRMGAPLTLTAPGEPPATHVAVAPPQPGPRQRLKPWTQKDGWRVEDVPPTAEELAAEAAAALDRRRAGMVLSAVQLSSAMFKAGKITAEEAEAFAARGDIPASMSAAIDAAMVAAGLDKQARTIARVQLAGATAYARLHPLTPLIGQALGLDDAALDDLFETGMRIL